MDWCGVCLSFNLLHTPMLRSQIVVIYKCHALYIQRLLYKSKELSSSWFWCCYKFVAPNSIDSETENPTRLIFQHKHIHLLNERMKKKCQSLLFEARILLLGGLIRVFTTANFCTLITCADFNFFAQLALLSFFMAMQTGRQAEWNKKTLCTKPK